MQEDNPFVYILFLISKASVSREHLQRSDHRQHTILDFIPVEISAWKIQGLVFIEKKSFLIGKDLFPIHSQIYRKKRHLEKSANLSSWGKS